MEVLPQLEPAETKESTANRRIATQGRQSRVEKHMLNVRVGDDRVLELIFAFLSFSLDGSMRAIEFKTLREKMKEFQKLSHRVIGSR